VLGTNPWFKKPRAIGEKFEILWMVLKVRLGERSKKNIDELRVLVKKLDNRTWPLLTIQAILFFVGALLFVFSSILKYMY